MTLFLVGGIFGYLTFKCVTAIGERRGWEFPAQVAIICTVLTVAMIPLVLLVKLLERVFS